ncbi:unnamed protein product, partial [Effrenium voratum]
LHIDWTVRVRVQRSPVMVAKRGFEDLPLDVSLRCVAVLPISDAPHFRRVCRRLSKLCGPEFSRTRARLGVRELRLVGAVTADPRKRSRALCDEAARVTMALQAHATSAAKDLLQIQGSELEAVILEVDRAASALVPENAAEMNTVEDADSGRTLHDWDSGGSMREVEVYAVVAGQLFLIGPAELQNLRWMMQMTDTEEQFAALQNARLYIADVSAEIQTSSGMKESGVLQRSNDSSFQVNPDLMSSSSSKNALEQGIRGQLLFCALEL